MVLSMAVTWLAGCATVEPRRAVLRESEGRFSASFTMDGRTNNSSGRFSLKLYADGLTLDLASPLGNTLARIETGPDGARLSYAGPDGDMRSMQGTNAEELSFEALGWRVPVSGLRYWIRGEPDPSRSSTSLPPAGFEQAHWVVRVQERFEADGSPRLLNFERSATVDAPAISLRLVLEAPSA